MARRKKPVDKMNACERHYHYNLAFSRDAIDNREIVDWFYGRIKDGKIGAADKYYAINTWGFYDAMAAMFRACRKYSRLNDGLKHEAPAA